MSTKITTAGESARFADEMAESFGDLHALGMIDAVSYKRTLRDLNCEAVDDVILPVSGTDIRAMRQTARVSQAVLAKYLNLSVDHVSKLERGAVRPTGALLAVLNVIRREGMGAIL